MEAAKLGIVTPQMKQVATDEQLDPEIIRTRVAARSIAIPANHHHTALVPHGVGEGLSTKTTSTWESQVMCAITPAKWKRYTRHSNSVPRPLWIYLTTARHTTFARSL